MTDASNNAVASQFAKQCMPRVLNAKEDMTLQMKMLQELWILPRGGGGVLISEQTHPTLYHLVRRLRRQQKSQTPHSDVQKN